MHALRRTGHYRQQAFPYHRFNRLSLIAPVSWFDARQCQQCRRNIGDIRVAHFDGVLLRTGHAGDDERDAYAALAGPEFEGIER